jgi:PKD repeat protein
MFGKFSKYTFNYGIIFWFVLSASTLIFFPVYDAFASTEVVLEWTPNSESDLVGYKVFCREEGQSYDYTNASWSGEDNYCTIYDLDETKTYCFVARAYDTEGFESDDSDEVCHLLTVIPDNQPPIANAGPDQTVDEGQFVNLNGSNSTDLDDGIDSYHWVQIGDPTVTLSDPNGQQPTFTVPDVSTEDECLAFELTVVDHSGLESRDSCIVNITCLNEPPVANAGPDQTVDEGVVVTLDGSYSIDIDDGIASYLWTQIGVPKVTLSNPASSQPTFTAPNVEQYGASLNFNLTVTDSGGMQKTDSCIVNVSWENEPPTAVVAPDYMESIEGTLVALDGSDSMDPDDGIASHLWIQVEGDPVSLSDPTSAVTTFTAPKTDQHGKNLKFKLTVKDFGGLQGTADSSIYVKENELQNNPPSAAFNVVTSKKVASFTNNSFDEDGTIVSWLWSFGDGKTSTERNPKHRYVKFRNYLVTLTVTDDKGASHSSSQTVTVSK